MVLSLLDCCRGDGRDERSCHAGQGPCSGVAAWHWADHEPACSLLPWKMGGCKVQCRAKWPSPHHVPVPGCQQESPLAVAEGGERRHELQPVTQGQLDESMRRASMAASPWEPSAYPFVRQLQEALGNHGSVDLMQNKLQNGQFVAVKRMPNKWVSVGPEEFQQRYPLSPEMPWVDIGLLRELNRRCFPYTCELLGMFCDSTYTYLVMSLARCGDLFSWCTGSPELGLEREALMRPIATQILAAVRWLHELGIAHRDLSLENILLTDDGGVMGIRIVDFGMATLSQTCSGQVRGKEAYQAPEVHTQDPYDTFVADNFQLGVVFFIMAACEKPWVTTKPGSCSSFGQFQVNGRLQQSSSGPLAGCSAAFMKFLEGLLEPLPQRRFTLAESCFAGEDRKTIWASPWLGVASDVLIQRWPCQKPIAPEEVAGAA